MTLRNPVGAEDFIPVSPSTGAWRPPRSTKWNFRLKTPKFSEISLPKLVPKTAPADAENEKPAEAQTLIRSPSDVKKDPNAPKAGFLIRACATGDPEKVLRWYQKYFIQQRETELPRLVTNHFRSPFPGIEKLTFTVGSHGLTLSGTEVKKANRQAGLLGVKPGWVVLFVNGKECANSREVQNHLQKAISRDRPYTIVFAKNAAQWQRVKAAQKLVAHHRQLHARKEKLEALPHACVSVSALASGAGLTEEAQQMLAQAVAQPLASLAVQPADIACHKENGRAICDIRIRNEASVLAVNEKIWRACLGGGEHAANIKKAFVKAGSAADAMPEVSIKWPLKRIHAVIQLDHGYNVPIKQLEKVINSITESIDAYKDPWNRIQLQEGHAIAEVMDEENLCCFIMDGKSQLMTIRDGQRRHLTQDWVTQDATQLPDLIADAMHAQQQLKAKLGPASAWSQQEMNDVQGMPQGHEARSWTSAERHICPNGSHYDPGVKSNDRVLEKAISMQHSLNEDPPVKYLVDVSRLGIIFDSPKDILKALRQIREHFNVVWVDNKYQNPSCLGYRDLNVGVKQKLPNQPHREHISEIQLLLRDMYVVKQNVGHKHYEALRSIFLACGVDKKDVNAVVNTILRELDCTDGKAAQQGLKEHQHISSYIKEHGIGEYEMSLVEDLLALVEEEFADTLETWQSEQELFAAEEERRQAQVEEAQRQAQAEAARLEELRKAEEAQAKAQAELGGMSEEEFEKMKTEMGKLMKCVTWAPQTQWRRTCMN